MNFILMAPVAFTVGGAFLGGAVVLIFNTAKKIGTQAPQHTATRLVGATALGTVAVGMFITVGLLTLADRSATDLKYRVERLEMKAMEQRPQAYLTYRAPEIVQMPTYYPQPPIAHQPQPNPPYQTQMSAEEIDAELEKVRERVKVLKENFIKQQPPEVRERMEANENKKEAELDPFSLEQPEPPGSLLDQLEMEKLRTKDATEPN